MRFIVETQSGRTFEVKNNGGLYFSINGFYYEVPSSWLNAWWEEWASADVPPIQTDPPVRPVDSLTWAQTLKAEDVDNIVVYYFGNGGEWYAKLTDAQIAEAVALINQSHGEKIEPESPPAPGNLIRFEVTTKNGVYTLTDGSGSYLCISGEYYQADKGWLRTWQKWQLVAVNFVEGWPVTTYTFQTGQALHTLEELSAQVSLDSNGRLMILDTEGWGPALGQLYQEEVFPNSEWYLPYLPNFAKTCQQVKDMVGQPGQLWICPYNYPTSGIIYFKLFLLYQTEDGSLYMGATKYQTGQEDDDKLLYLYQLDLVTQTTDEPHIWAQNLKAEDIAAMTLLVRGETYQLEPGTRKFQRYLAKITQASGTKMATMENAYAFDVTILVDTTDGKRHIVVNDSGEKLMIDGYYYQVDTDWLYSWWEEWRQS